MTNEGEHARARDSFSGLLEGDLPDEDRRFVDQHLRTCIVCRTELEHMRRTLGTLVGLRAKAPPTFLADIQTQIHERSKGRFFGRKWRLFGRIPFEWASMAMIIAMLVYYIVTLYAAPSGIIPGG